MIGRWDGASIKGDRSVPLVCCAAMVEALTRCPIWHTRVVALERQGATGPVYRTARLCSVHRASALRIGVMLAPTTVRWRIDERGAEKQGKRR